MEAPTPKVYTERLRQTLNRFPQKACFHVKRQGVWQSWTYAEAGRIWSTLVPALRTLGLGRGEHAVVIGDNTPEWVLAWHGVVLSGACVVPVDPNLPADEIREICRVTAPRVVFCSPVYRPLFESIQPSPRVITLPTGDGSVPGDWTDLVSSAAPLGNPFDLPLGPEDPLAVLFTSGTTGRSKGVVLLQRNLVSAAEHGVPLMGLDHTERTLAILPLHHVFGYAGCVVIELLSGMDIVFVPTVKGPLILEALQERNATILPAVPQMIELFHGNIRRTVAAKGAVVGWVFSALHLLSRVLGPVLGPGFRRALFGSVHRGFGGKLRLIVSGGSSLRAAPFRAFQEMGFDIVEGYGLTETFGPITICPKDDPRQGSVGRVIDDNEIRIHEPDASGIGEVCFRGATVFPGYFRNEEATRAVFDGDGWFHTGDLGRVTQDGFVYLTGRIKDVIILDSGKNVYPDELEEFYLTQSTVIEEIGVLGLRRGANEVPVAVIVPNKDLRRRLDPAEAEAVVRGELARLGANLPSYKKVLEFRLSFHPLPRTSTRKIKKNELRPLFDQASATAGPLAQHLTVAETEMMAKPAFQRLSTFLRRLAKVSESTPVSPRTHLEMDLHLDSLSRVELLTWMERELGRAMPEGTLQRLETAGDVATILGENQGGVPGAVPLSATPGAPVLPKGEYVWHLPLGLFLVRTISRLCWAFRAHGQTRVPDQGGLIFCVNHESYLDIAWVLASLSKPVLMKTWALGKAEMGRHPVLRGMMKNVRVIAVEREGDVRGTLDVAEACLRDGRNLIIFPEGTRTRSGQLGRFRSGVGELLLRTKATVVPVKVRGGYGIWPADGRPKFLFARKYQGSITYGEAIPFDGIAASAADGSAAALTEVIRRRIEAL